jgi:hypothetical protein
MLNFKWGGIAGCIAFVLALLTSLLLGQTTFLVALLRASIFAAVFFAIVLGASALIKTYIPDLLNPIAPTVDETKNIFTTASPGSRVNITLDDSHEAAVPESDDDSFDSGNVGDFSDLMTGKIQQTQKSSSDRGGDIDQSFTSSYTNDTEFAPAFGESDSGDSDEFSVDFGAFVGDGDEDGSEGGDEPLTDSFSFFSGDDDSAHSEDASRQERKTVSRNKPTKFEGDFDPKEIAVGIRTVLEKDKKRG